MRKFIVSLVMLIGLLFTVSAEVNIIATKPSCNRTYIYCKDDNLGYIIMVFNSKYIFVANEATCYIFGDNESQAKESFAEVWDYSFDDTRDQDLIARRNLLSKPFTTFTTAFNKSYKATWYYVMNK